MAFSSGESAALDRLPMIAYHGNHLSRNIGWRFGTVLVKKCRSGNVSLIFISAQMNLDNQYSGSEARPLSSAETGTGETAGEVKQMLSIVHKIASR